MLPGHAREGRRAAHWDAQNRHQITPEHARREPDWFAVEGLYYPSTGILAGGGQHNLAWQFTGDRRFERANGSLVDLVRELGRNSPESVFISSEDFEPLHRRAAVMSEFRSALETLGYRVEIVVVLREAVDYVPSLYEELRKHSLEQTLNIPLLESSRNGGVIFRDWEHLCINYERLVTEFADIFGIGAVHALRYDRQDSVGMVLDAASALLGVPLVPIHGWTRRNTRMPDLSGIASEHVNVAGRDQFDLRKAAS